MDRNTAIKNLLLSGAGVFTLGNLGVSCDGSVRNIKRNNTFKQSVCRWCFNQFTLEQMCIAIKKMGLYAIDLCGVNDWKTLQSHGIYSSMCNGAEIDLVRGFNNQQYHDELTKRYTELIPLVAKNGYKNLICFSGNANGMDTKVGMKNMKKGIERILPLAEKYHVTLCLELFNTKVDHPDYMANSSAWGVDLCKSISSNNFKLLYDIYHMQIEEGNIIDTIKKIQPYVAHYHTAGVPGRHEINQSQELNYGAVFESLNYLNFDGYLAHEFIPTYDNPWSSLQEAVSITNYVKQFN